MGKMLELDEAVDQLGFLRLSTTSRLVRHIGNVIPDDLLAEADDLDLSKLAGKTIASDEKHWMMRNKFLRKILWFLHDRSYRIINNVRVEEK